MLDCQGDTKAAAVGSGSSGTCADHAKFTIPGGIHGLLQHMRLRADVSKASKRDVIRVTKAKKGHT